jgi:hypothetical protein
MARRDPGGIRLIRGNDCTTRYPLVAEAVNHLKVRSCLIDERLATEEYPFTRNCGRRSGGCIRP